MQFLRWRLKWFIMPTQKTRSENKKKEEGKEEVKKEDREEKEEVPGVVTTAAIGKPLAIPFAMVTEQHNTSSQQ